MVNRIGGVGVGRHSREHEMNRGLSFELSFYIGARMRLSVHARLMMMSFAGLSCRRAHLIDAEVCDTMRSSQKSLGGATRLIITKPNTSPLSSSEQLPPRQPREPKQRKRSQHMERAPDPVHAVLVTRAIPRVSHRVHDAAHTPDQARGRRCHGVSEPADQQRGGDGG